MLPGMNPRQRHAFEHPCTRAEDTADPIYCRVLPFKGGTWGTFLTVNK
jgi:hypothetical protein